MNRLLLSLLAVLLLLAACVPGTLSIRETVSGVFVVGYIGTSGQVLDLLELRGPNIQPSEAYGFLNLVSRSGSAIVFTSQLLTGVGNLTNTGMAASIRIAATVEDRGVHLVVVMRGEPPRDAASLNARRQLVEVLDDRFERFPLSDEEAEGSNSAPAGPSQRFHRSPRG